MATWWTSDRQAYAVNYLKQNANLSDVGARGLVSRWMNVEAPAGPGSINPSSGAQGIAQWLGDRAGGYTLDNFDSQLAKAVTELNGSEKAAGDTLRSATTDAQAATGASMFERAAGYNPSTGRDNFTAQTQAGIAGIASATPQIASYSRGFTSDPSRFIASTDTLAPGYTVYPGAPQTAQATVPALSPTATVYPDAQTVIASAAGPPQGVTPQVPGVTSLHPDVASALGFAPTASADSTPAWTPYSAATPVSSAQITANLQPYSTMPLQSNIGGGAMPQVYGGGSPVLNFGSGSLPPVTPSQQPALQSSVGAGTMPQAYGAPTTFPDQGAGTFTGGYGGNPSATPQTSYPPSAGQPVSSLSGLSPNQLPLSEPQNTAAPYAGPAQGPPAASAAPPMAAAQAPGGVMATIGNIAHAVISSPVGQKITAALTNPGALTGITGFGNGPLPANVTNQSSFSNWLGGQNWEGPGTGRGASLYNSSGGINPSGGSAYQYFAPSTPGGIGGYVANGQVFTYPTTDTQDFFHTAGN